MKGDNVTGMDLDRLRFELELCLDTICEPSSDLLQLIGGDASVSSGSLSANDKQHKQVPSTPQEEMFSEEEDDTNVQQVQHMTERQAVMTECQAVMTECQAVVPADTAIQQSTIQQSKYSFRPDVLHGNVSFKKYI